MAIVYGRKLLEIRQFNFIVILVHKNTIKNIVYNVLMLGQFCFGFYLELY